MHKDKNKHSATTGTCLPSCFGDIDKVFPMTENGLRQTPDECMFFCDYKTACLKKAMTGSGGKNVQEEMIERGEKAGVIGFFERWSRKKRLSRQNAE